MNEHGHSQSRRRAFARGQANDFDEKHSWKCILCSWVTLTDVNWHQKWNRLIKILVLLGTNWKPSQVLHERWGFNVHPVHCQHSAMLEETPFKRIPAHLYTSTTLALGIQLVFVMPFDLSFPRRREGDAYFHQLTNRLSSQGTKWNWVPWETKRDT